MPGGSGSRAKLDVMQPSATPYEERLTAPRSWWLISFLVGVSFALILLPFGTLPLLGGLVGGTAAAGGGGQRLRLPAHPRRGRLPHRGRGEDPGVGARHG
ncbi:hypothetical protein GCM10017687_88890 [Streptomyces echinatus]